MRARSFYPTLLGWTYAALLLTLLLLAGARLALIQAYGLGYGFSDLLPVFSRGARFDAKTIAVLALLPLLTAALAGVIKPLRLLVLRCYQVWLSIALLAVALLALINHFYYRNFQNHIDIFIFGLVEDDVGAVFATIWQDYPWLLFLALLALICYALFRALPALARRLHFWPPRWYAQAGYLVLALLALLLLARGSLGVFPLSTDTHLAVSPSTFLNRAVVNGTYALYDAFENRYRSARPARVAMAEARQAYARLQTLEPERYSGTLPSAEQLFWQPPLGAALPRAPHVVVALRESFGSQLLEFHSQQNDLLGALQPHWRQDLVFLNFVSATLGTHSSLEKILFNLPMRDLTLSDLRKLPFPSSLPRFYQSAGYQSHYVTGGNKNWHDLDLLLPHQGFGRLHDQVDIAAALPQVEYDGNWGVFDQYTYDYVLHLLRTATEPQFIFILTTSNHSPYSTPASYKRSSPELTPELRAIAFDQPEAKLRQVLHAYQYANDAFGNFLSQLKADPDLSALTIVAATGDHHSRDIIRYDADPELLAYRYLVPLYLYLPPAIRSRSHYHPERVGSHWDLGATLIAASQPQRGHFAFGHDLLAADLPPQRMGFGPNFYLHESGAIEGGRFYLKVDDYSPRLIASTPSLELKQAQDWQRARYRLLTWWFGEYLQAQAE